WARWTRDPVLSTQCGRSRSASPDFDLIATAHEDLRWHLRCSGTKRGNVPMPRGRIDWENLDWEEFPDGPGPQTESAKESGFPREVNDEEYGRAEELDGNGDIADETPGHRG